MKVTLIAGARPNFMKIGPIVHAIENAKASNKSIDYRLVHTGQHYDEKLSNSFFKDLNIPEPHVNLGVGSGSHAVQTANIMIKFEEELASNPCDFVLVVGDVNSTVACALVAKKMNTKVIHVEAGLRSYDMRMPEEINRIATDALADVFFTTTPEAGYNLIEKGCNKSNIYFVGNTMIDSLVSNLGNLVKPALFDDQALSETDYLVMTLHRPSNVDEQSKLAKIINLIGEKCNGKKVIFPVHPRTKQILDQFSSIPENIYCTEPLGYLEFMYLVKNSFAVITDSGGIQEETTYLGIPCITLRENTERPETTTLGTNELLGFNVEAISNAFSRLFNGEWKRGSIPGLWDGKAAERIVRALIAMNTH
ncbi:non-hydrolyzing UDP-N-acetylglucosamine 2-epimerase [Splendidivirga corallicola]